MRLSEISGEFIDKMLLVHPIRGCLTHKSLMKYKKINKHWFGTFQFHYDNKIGWIDIDAETLKQSSTYQKEGCEPVILKTPSGVLYAVIDEDLIFFKKYHGRTDSRLKRITFSLDFSYGLNRNEICGYLLLHGFEYKVNRFIWDFTSNSGWETKYFSYEKK